MALGDPADGRDARPGDPLRERKAPDRDGVRRGAPAGGERRPPAGDRHGLAGDAGHALGLRLSHRRRRRLRPGRGDRLPGRRRLRHQLRLPADDDPSAAGGHPGPSAGTRDGPLSGHPLRRRLAGPPEALPEGTAAGPPGRGGLGRPPGLRRRGRSGDDGGRGRHGGRRPGDGERPGPGRGARTSSGRSGRETTFSRSRWSRRSSIRRPPRPSAWSSASSAS